jgi:heme exporter protein C
MNNRNIFYSMTLVGFLLFVAALFMIFLYVPTEAEMGIVQKIFYFHVPVAWIGFLAFFIVFIASIIYLRKREAKWDFVANSSAEIGVVFTTLALITGSIWAKPIWGVWWTWEPRLTTTLVLWLIYIIYLIIRSFTRDQQQGNRFAAIIGILGFIDVPIVFLAITLWRTQHPGPVIFQGGLEFSMLLTLIVSIAAFTMLYYLLLILVLSHKKNYAEYEKLYRNLNS